MKQRSRTWEHDHRLAGGMFKKALPMHEDGILPYVLWVRFTSACTEQKQDMLHLLSAFRHTTTHHNALQCIGITVQTA